MIASISKTFIEDIVQEAIRQAEVSLASIFDFSRIHEQEESFSSKPDDLLPPGAFPTLPKGPPSQINRGAPVTPKVEDYLLEASKSSSKPSSRTNSGDGGLAVTKQMLQDMVDSTTSTTGALTTGDVITTEDMSFDGSMKVETVADSAADPFADIRGYLKVEPNELLDLKGFSGDKLLALTTKTPQGTVLERSEISLLKNQWAKNNQGFGFNNSGDPVFLSTKNNGSFSLAGHAFCQAIADLVREGALKISFGNLKEIQKFLAKYPAAEAGK